MRNGPCTPHYRTAENEQVVANQGGGQHSTLKKLKTVGENKVPMNYVNYLPHWQSLRTSLGKAQLHLKLYLAELCKQDYPNYTELWKPRRPIQSAVPTVPVKPGTAAPVAANIKSEKINYMTKLFIQPPPYIGNENDPFNF